MSEYGGRENALITEAELVIATPDMVQATNCTTDICVPGDPEVTELSRDHEMQLEQLDTTAEQWSKRLQSARSKSTDAIIYIRNEINNGVQERGINGKSRRLSAGPTNDVIANELALDRQASIDYISTGVAEAVGSKSVHEVLAGDEAGLRLLHQHLSKQKAHIEYAEANGIDPYLADRKEGATVTDSPYRTVFVYELLARTELALAAQQMPNVLYAITAPSGISEQPEHLQALFALDLNSRDSAIKKITTNRQSAETTFFDYLTENNLNPAIKQLTYAIKVGAQAARGCAVECPLNSVGLCKEVANAIPVADLPTDIQADLQKRQGSTSSQRLLALRNFAGQQKTTDWLFFDTVIRPLSRDELQGSLTLSPGRRNRTKGYVGPSIKALEQGLKPPLTKEIVAPPQLAVSGAGLDGIIGAETSDEASVQGLIEATLASSEFSKLLLNNRHEANFPDFVAGALKTIFTAGNYREERSLVPMSDFAAIYSGVDRSRLTVWRLKGMNHRGSAGRAANSLRIFFGVSNANGVRRIEFIRAADKANVSRLIRQGSM